MLKTRDMVLEELQSQGARLESVSAAMASVPQEITNLRQQLEDVRDVLSQSMRLAAEHATAFERAEETLQGTYSQNPMSAKADYAIRI
jgi:ABC-type transporter Mla subunit MlaD